MEKIKHLLPQIISKPDKLTISDKCRVKIKCACGKIVDTSIRSLVRKYNNRSWICKNCSVKSYINNSERIRKFNESMKKIIETTEHKLKCSINGKKAWEDPEIRARVTEAVRQDNKTNPKKRIARAIALKALMEKHNGKEHLARIRQQQDGKISIPEKIVESILREKKIEFIQQYKLGYYTFDFYIPSKKILIEVQGEYWHKETQNKDSAKAEYASNQGYQVKHIWENEFSEFKKVDEIINLWLELKPLEQINFKLEDIKISEIDNKTARIFLGKYHYLPAISKSGYHLGAFLETKLIASITFSAITRKETAERLKLNYNEIKEVGRFCIAPQHHKKNFASWFLSKTIKFYLENHPQIKRLISFADTTIHDGTIYKASNWQEDGETDYNYMYRSSDGYLIHKKTVWDRAKKMQITEEEYINKNNYIKVWSKPKKRFLFPYQR